MVPAGKGRPEKSEEFKRSSEIRIRVTEFEKTELENAANGSLSSWARDVLLKAARKRKTD